MNTERSSESVRKARRELHAKVRSDWDAVLARALPSPSLSAAANADSSSDSVTPPTTNATESTPTTANGDSWRHPFRRWSSRPGNTDSSPGTPPSAASVAAEALEWRERTYASSDPSSDEDSADEQPRRFSCTRRTSAKGANQAQDKTQDPLNHAASLSSFDERKKQDRKRRRRKRLEDEMAVNPGLRYWERRRDIWCLAQSFPIPTEPQLSLPEIQPLDLDISTSSLESTSPTNSSLSSSSLPSSESSAAAQPVLSPIDSAKGYTHPDSSQAPNLAQSQQQQQHHAYQTQQLLPVARPLLPPTDPTRQTINPSTYPSIYTKLVTQSVAPSIPINLSHVVPALVQGWKDNGEWPPRSSPTGTAAQHTSATGASVVVKTSQQLARAVGNSSTSVMRKLCTVDDAKTKGKNRRLLGQALVRGGGAAAVSEQPPLDTAGAVNTNSGAGAQTSGPADTPPRGSTTPTASTPTTAPEKEGSGTSAGENAGATSPRRVRRGVVMVGRALRDSLSGGSSSPSPTSAAASSTAAAGGGAGTGTGTGTAESGVDGPEARIVIEM